MIANLGVGKVNEVDVSPDGRELLFTKPDGVYLINTDGTNLRSLAVRDTLSATSPYASWSPDGSKITVLGRGTYSVIDSRVVVLFTMARDGSDIRALITGNPPQPGHGELLQPAEDPAVTE